MVTTCVAYNCKNRADKGTRKSFFRFPANNLALLSKWTTAVQSFRGGKWTPNNHSRLCQDHFNDCCFIVGPTGVKHLKKNSVPSVFNCEPVNKIKRQKRERLKEEIPDQEDWNDVNKPLFHNKISPTDCVKTNMDCTDSHNKTAAHYIKSETKNSGNCNDPCNPISPCTVNNVDSEIKDLETCIQSISSTSDNNTNFETKNSDIFYQPNIHTIPSTSILENLSLDTEIILEHCSPDNSISDKFSTTEEEVSVSQSASPNIFLVNVIQSSDTQPNPGETSTSKESPLHNSRQENAGKEITVLKRRLSKYENKCKKFKKTIKSLRNKLQSSGISLTKVKAKLSTCEKKILTLERIDIGFQNVCRKGFFKPIMSKILERHVVYHNSGCITKKPFDTDVKKFCLALHFYSPKAYAYLRNFLHLPNPRSLRRWAADIDCHPDLFKEAFLYLTRRAEESKELTVVPPNFNESYLKRVAKFFEGHFCNEVDLGVEEDNGNASQEVHIPGLDLATGCATDTSVC